MAAKRLITILLTVALVGGGCALYYGLAGSGGAQTFQADLPVPLSPARASSFELAGELPNVDNNMMVYKLKPAEVSLEKAVEMGRRLGFEGQAGIDAQGIRIGMAGEINGEKKMFGVWVNSGAVEYSVVEPNLLCPLEPPALPSNEEAAAIATRFLDEAGLLPAGAQVSEVVWGGRYAGENGEEYVTHLLVRFGHEIDGIPAIGPGARFDVRIADKGEVADLYRDWRDVDPYREVSIKTADQAYQELVSGKGSYYVPETCQKVVVDKVRLVYWMGPDDREKQDYVVPVYEFDGRCLGNDGTYLQDFTGWCQAVT
jgi:hypothetical protein